MKGTPLFVAFSLSFGSRLKRLSWTPRSIARTCSARSGLGLLGLLEGLLGKLHLVLSKEPHTHPLLDEPKLDGETQSFISPKRRTPRFLWSLLLTL